MNSSYSPRDVFAVVGHLRRSPDAAVRDRLKPSLLSVKALQFVGAVSDSGLGHLCSPVCVAPAGHCTTFAAQGIGLFQNSGTANHGATGLMKLVW